MTPEEAKAFVQEHRDELPAELVAAPTVENVRRFLQPAFLEVATDSGVVTHDLRAGSGSGSAAPETIDPSVIWQIGKDLWDLVEDNKPTVNVTLDWAGAVPQGIKDWTTMTGWKLTRSSDYKFEFKNFLGMKLTEFIWIWSAKYGGQYNGIGQYVTQAGAVVQSVYAYTTEHVDVSVTAFKPLNYGTKAAPIGGVDVSVSMTSWGLFEKTTVACQVTFKGDGSVTVVKCAQNQ